MERHELTELHYITPIANVASIVRYGILSHIRSKRVQHESVAMSEIQDRRAKVTVPGGKQLHEYANLYICARNPMMYRRQARHREMCVLRVDSSVINLPNVVITDCNASGDYVRFAAGPGGLLIVNREWTFADDWRDNDQIQYFRKKAAKCAEVLMPDRISPGFIMGAYVSCQEALDSFQAQTTGISVSINGHLFFR